MKRFVFTVIIIAAVLLILALLIPKPASYVYRAVTELVTGDEVMVVEETYVFVSGEAVADADANDPTLRLTFTDDEGTVVESTTPPDTLILVKVPPPPWRFTAPPVPTPAAVTVPVPVPPVVPGGTAPIPSAPVAPTPTVPPITSAPMPLPPGTSVSPTPIPVLPTPTQPVTALCADGIWNGDESDLDCGGSCQACIATGMYTACWDGSDCASGTCDMSAALPLQPGDTTASLRARAGDTSIIPYQGRCQ